MLDTVLKIAYLNDNAVSFVGDSRETEEIKTPIGPMENEYKFPMFQVSREMWEAAGMPTIIRLTAVEALNFET